MMIASNYEHKLFTKHQFDSFNEGGEEVRWKVNAKRKSGSIHIVLHIFLSIHVPFRLYFLSVYLSIYLYPSTYLSVHPSIFTYDAAVVVYSPLNTGLGYAKKQKKTLIITIHLSAPFFSCGRDLR